MLWALLKAAGLNLHDCMYWNAATQLDTGNLLQECTHTHILEHTVCWTMRQMGYNHKLHQFYLGIILHRYNRLAHWQVLKWGKIVTLDTLQNEFNTHTLQQNTPSWVSEWVNISEKVNVSEWVSECVSLKMCLIITKLSACVTDGGVAGVKNDDSRLSPPFSHGSCWSAAAVGEHEQTPLPLFDDQIGQNCICEIHFCVVCVCMCV